MRGGAADIIRHTRSTVVGAGTRPSRGGKLADADQVPTVNVCRVGLGGAGKLGRVGRRRKIRGGIGMDAGGQRCSWDKKLTSCSRHLAITEGHGPELRGPAGLADGAGGGTCAGSGMSATATQDTTHRLGDHSSIFRSVRYSQAETDVGILAPLCSCTEIQCGGRRCSAATGGRAHGRHGTGAREQPALIRGRGHVCGMRRGGELALWGEAGRELGRGGVLWLRCGGGGEGRMWPGGAHSGLRGKGRRAGLEGCGDTHWGAWTAAEAGAEAGAVGISGAKARAGRGAAGVRLYKLYQPLPSSWSERRLLLPCILCQLVR